jgi:hypothetical protein
MRENFLLACVVILKSTSKEVIFVKTLLSFLISIGVSTTCLASQCVFSIRGTKLYLNNQEFKIIGLRCSNALVSDRTTQELINQLDTYKSYGINMVSVYFMGSRFGDVKGYNPDATLNAIYAHRMARIIEAADKRGMIVLVGCLYWSTSKAKEDLSRWKQEDANRAVSNTVKWLVEHNYRNVFVDPDNEGMAARANSWRIESMIAAAHEVDPSIMVANNNHKIVGNCDLNIHHGPKKGYKPWLDTEATPGKTPGGYWGRFSKETHQADNTYYNYSRIGRYTAEMKKDQLNATREHMEKYNGYVLASTWIQCGLAEDVNGPFTRLGGQSNLGSNDNEQDAWNMDINTTHPDAGILWWMEFVKETYGPWHGAAKEISRTVEQNPESHEW